MFNPPPIPMIPLSTHAHAPSGIPEVPPVSYLLSPSAHTQKLREKIVILGYADESRFWPWQKPPDPSFPGAKRQPRRRPVSLCITYGFMLLTIHQVVSSTQVRVRFQGYRLGLALIPPAFGWSRDHNGSSFRRRRRRHHHHLSTMFFCFGRFYPISCPTSSGGHLVCAKLKHRFIA